MTAKEYLSQATGIKTRLEAMAEQFAFLKSAAEYVAPQYSHLPKSATRNVHKTEDAIVRLMEFEERMSEQYVKLDEINSVINTVSDPVMQVVLAKRYFGREKWGEIANALYISIAHTHRLHNLALAELENLIQNETK